jgi:hypothetical protein
MPGMSGPLKSVAPPSAEAGSMRAIVPFASISMRTPAAQPPGSRA